MTAADILNISLLLSAGMLSLALCLTTLRIILGPTLADRVVGLDMLVALAICLITIQSIRTGNAFGLDIAMALAIAGFLATVAFARYILVRKSGNGTSPADPPPQTKAAPRPKKTRVMMARNAEEISGATGTKARRMRPAPTVPALDAACMRA